MTWAQFVERLRAERLLPADGALPARGSATLSWHMRAVAGFGAWLAASFVLSALGGVFALLADSKPLQVVLGALLCGASALAMRRPARGGGVALRDGAFTAQFALVFAIAGAALLAVSLLGGIRNTSLQGLGVAALAAVLLWANPEQVHRTLAAFVLVGALTVVAVVQRIEPLPTVLLAGAASGVWLTQPRWVAAGYASVLTPLGYALALALLLLQVPDAIPQWTSELGHWAISPGGHAVLRAIVLAAALAGTAIVLLRGAGAAPVAGANAGAGESAGAARGGRAEAAVLVAVALIAAVAWRTPGLLASVLVWVLASASGRSELLTMAWTGLAGYLWMLYWSMQIDLMSKGLTLVASGLVLLAVRFVFVRLWPAARNGDDLGDDDHGSGAHVQPGPPAQAAPPQAAPPAIGGTR